jgi:hypothetical protein
MYNVIESSPDDQIPPKLFVLIKRTIIYISSDKFVAPCIEQIDIHGSSIQYIPIAMMMW